MANPRNPNHSLFSLLLLFPFFVLSSSLYSPQDNHLVACGSTSVPALADHRRFFPDSSCHLHSSGATFAVSDPSRDSPPLHRTARVFSKPSSYEFRVKEKGTHLIRLHFYPFSTSDFNLSSASFHVAAYGISLLSNFATSVPVLKEFLIPVDAEKLVVSFFPAEKSSFAFVNAIEVVSAPGDLIGHTASLVKPDQVEIFNGLSRQSFETIYRINIGGPKVTPFNDSLWRTWVPDTEGLGFVKLDSSASKTVSFSGRISYRKYGASREVAPDNVYSTARVSDSDHNMTWVFPVSLGYRYLVRMHFCDFASVTLNQLYFNIYVNGYLAYKNFDLSDATGQLLASPFYIDFVADVGSSGLLTIGIGPSKLSNPSWVPGLLNGLEIMKMNNTFGNLDEQVPLVLTMEDPAFRGIGEFVRSILCGFAFTSLLVVVFILALRLRAELRNTLGWSPLPTDVPGSKLAKGYTVASGMLDF
ncbi:probable receptor-like protein kinase At5g24010 [Typha angustifolia]|uniref:probable receptor-like protein kinase At5g24010 n=1 Tax=Typha angustifolia TaxID=59011 RepID=UPI003C30AD71